jgi:hypothetical protein
MVRTKRRYKKKTRTKTRKKRGGSKNTEKQLNIALVSLEKINKQILMIREMNKKQFKEWRRKESLNVNGRGMEKNPCDPKQKKCISTLNKQKRIMELQRDALISMGQEDDRRDALEINSTSRPVSTERKNVEEEERKIYGPGVGDMPIPPPPRRKKTPPPPLHHPKPARKSRRKVNSPTTLIP